MLRIQSGHGNGLCRRRAVCALSPRPYPRRHTHGLIGDAEVIIDLRNDRTVAIAERHDAIRGNAKKSDVRKVLQAAAENFDRLVDAWEPMHHG